MSEEAGEPTRGTLQSKGRRRITGSLEGKMTGSSSPETVSTRLERIAKLAKGSPKMVISTLAHHIDVEWLREAHRLTRKDGARGVDGQSAESYAANLEPNLQTLLDCAKSGTYRAPPVRRVHIPKPNGETRPLGIPTFEDKVLQRAVAMALGAVYEQDFHDGSYGFRPGRSAHDMLEALRVETTKMAGGWLIEIDIRKYFESIPHRDLTDAIRRRVTDGVLLRLIGKWLNAGVLERGEWSRSDEGTPQGGVISPLLANIYLHVVLDEWFKREVKPRLRGRAHLFRYADDAVLLFERESDARRVYEVLPKRFAKHGLTLHPDKTRLIELRRPDRQMRESKRIVSETFDLLGFTHFWKNGRYGWRFQRKTARDRFRRALTETVAWCKQWRHELVGVQHRALSQKVRGHYGYFGISGNSNALSRFWFEVRRAWCKWLNRRSQRRASWDDLQRLMRRFPLPTPRILRPRTLRSANP